MAVIGAWRHESDVIISLTVFQWGVLCWGELAGVGFLSSRNGWILQGFVFLGGSGVLGAQVVGLGSKSSYPTSNKGSPCIMICCPGVL
jgi:hypothetical protein